MTAQDLHIVITVVSFFTFIGIVWWAYSAPRKAAFDAAARMPLEDDDSTFALAQRDRHAQE